MRPRTKRPSLLTAGRLSAVLAAGALGWYAAGLTAPPAAEPLLCLPQEEPAFTGSIPLTAPRLRLSPDPLAPIFPAALSLDDRSFGPAAARDPLDLGGPVLDDLRPGGAPDSGSTTFALPPSGTGFDANAAALAAIRAAAAGSSFRTPGQGPARNLLCGKDPERTRKRENTKTRNSKPQSTRRTRRLR